MHFYFYITSSSFVQKGEYTSVNQDFDHSC